MLLNINKVVLEYKGKQYKLDCSDFGKGGGSFIWEEGNYGCDCNRSLFLRKHYQKEKVPDMKCNTGENKIKLISLETEDGFIRKYDPPQ